MFQGKQPNHKGPRHTLAPMSMRDVADAIGISVPGLYKKLSKMCISTSSVKKMSLKELIYLIISLKEGRDPKATTSVRVPIK